MSRDSGLGLTVYETAPKAKYVPTRGINYGQPSAGEITQEEFKQALTEYKDKGEISADLKEKFNEYIEHGYVTYVNGSNREVSDLYRNYLLKEATKRQGAELDTILGPGSSFYGHIKGSHKDTTASLMLDFIESVRRDGKDKAALDPQLALKLYDTRNGFGSTASDIQTMKNSSDPLVKGVYEIAVKLGLNAVIAKTRSDVINGVRSERTKHLPSKLVDGIMNERFAKNKALLPSDGSMVIGYDRNNRPIKVDGFKISDTFIDNTGAERSPFKDQANKQIDYAKFFEGLTELQIKDDNDAARDKYVMDFLTAVFEHYDQKIKAADKPESKEEIRKEERAVAANLTGRGLISSEMCAPVIAAIRSSGTSAEVTERLTTNKLDKLAVDLIDQFKYEVTNSDAAKTLEHIRSMWDKTGQGKIALIDPDSFNIDKKELNGRISDADMTASEKQDGTKVTIETAYDAYHQARKGSINKVFDGLITKQILGSGYVSSESIDASQRDFVKALDKAKATTQNKAGLERIITEQLQAIVSKAVNKDDKDEIAKAVDKFVAKLTGFDASSLQKKIYDKNGDLLTARNKLAILVSGATPSTNKDEIKTAVEKLFAGIIARKVGNDNATIPGAAQELVDSLQIKSRQGRDTISALFEGFRAVPPNEEGLTRVLDLEKLQGFVKANNKLKDLVVDHSNKRAFEEIELAPQEAGSLVSLIYKKEDGDANKNDYAANLVGVLGVISRLKENDPKKEELINALVKDIYKNDTSVSDQANTEKRVLVSQALLSIVKGDPGYTVTDGRKAAGVKIGAKDPGFYLSTNALKLLKDNLETAFLPAYGQDEREKLAGLLNAHIAKLKPAIAAHQQSLDTSKANILASLDEITKSAATLAPSLLDDARTVISGPGVVDLSAVNDKLNEVKSSVDTARTAIGEVKTALSVRTKTNAAVLRAAVDQAKLKLQEAKLPANLFKQLDAALGKVTTDPTGALGELTTIETGLTDTSKAIVKSSADIKTELVSLTTALKMEPDKKLTAALNSAQKYLNVKATKFDFSTWLTERVVVATERERFLSKAFSLMSSRESLYKGWYSSGFIALFAPADEAKASRADQVELLKRMNEHEKADDPVKSLREALSTANDDDSKRLLNLFDGIHSKSRDVHEGPDVQVMHSKNIFERMVEFVQNFIMNRSLQTVSAPRYYPEFIRKRIEQAGNDGASLASSRPAASPAKPVEAPAPSLN